MSAVETSPNPRQPEQATLDAAYADLIDSDDLAWVVARRHGIALEALQRHCGKEDGHDMTSPDPGEGLWYRGYGRYCAICGILDEGFDE